MLIPLPLQSAQDRQRMVAGLRQHDYTIILPSGAAAEDIAARLGTQPDLWIATTRNAGSTYFHSLLHADVDPDAGATVDVLVIDAAAAADGTDGYVGNGELTALLVLLERRNVARVRVPIKLNLAKVDLPRGWSALDPQTLVFVPPT